MRKDFLASSYCLKTLTVDTLKALANHINNHKKFKSVPLGSFDCIHSTCSIKRKLVHLSSIPRIHVKKKKIG